MLLPPKQLDVLIRENLSKLPDTWIKLSLISPKHGSHFSWPLFQSTLGLIGPSKKEGWMNLYDAKFFEISSPHQWQPRSRLILILGWTKKINPRWNIKTNQQKFTQFLPGDSSRDLFVMVKTWSFQGVKTWPPTRGWKGHGLNHQVRWTTKKQI